MCWKEVGGHIKGAAAVSFIILSVPFCIRCSGRGGAKLDLIGRDRKERWNDFTLGLRPCELEQTR